MSSVRVVRASEFRQPEAVTHGMDRREAFAGDGVWAEGSSAGSNGVEAVLVRIGQGDLVTNVDAPDPA